MNINKARQALYNLYAEYVEIHVSSSSGSEVSFQIVTNDPINTTSSGSSSIITHVTGMSEFLSHIATVKSVQPQKNELDTYFEYALLTVTEDSSLDIVNSDALKW